MKRRKFLGGIAGSSAMLLGGGAAAQQRVHGRPMYLDPFAPTYHRLVLALNNANVPMDVWSDIENFCTAWRSLSLSEESKQLFYQDTQAWLEAFGIPSTTMNANDVEVRLLRAFVGNPILRESLGDYHAFCSYLVSENIFDPTAPQLLRRKIREAIRANRTQIEELLRSQDMERLMSGEAFADYPLYELEELAAEINALAETTTSAVQVAIAAIFVAVAVFVVTYAGVGVNLTAVLNVSVEISVLTHQAIWLCGPVHQYHTAMNNPFFQSLMALDEETKANITNAARAAYLCERPDYAVQLVCDFVESETRTILEAANDTGLIKLPERADQRERYFELCGKVARKTLIGSFSAA